MPEFEILDRETCLQLLATTDLGRFAVIIENSPAVFPVNYVLDGDIVTFRTAPGAKLEASLHSRVAFEVDYLAADRLSAWSVLVQGSVDRMGMTPEERTRIAALNVRTVAPGDKPVWVRIVPDRIGGRRLEIKDESWAFDPHGYL